MVEELTCPRTIGYVKSVARKFVSKCDVEDVVQETMVRAISNSHRYTTGNFRAWLGRIAYNYICDVRKRASVEFRELLDDDYPHYPVFDDGLSQELKWALSGLKDMDRRVLLNIACGMDAAECAEDLNLNVQAVRARLCRARRFMKRILR